MKEQRKFSIRLDEKIKEDLDEYCWWHRMTLTAAIEIAVRALMDGKIDPHEYDERL